MSYDVMPSNIQLGEKEERGQCSELWCLSSQVTVADDGALLSWRWLSISLPAGNSE